MNEGYKLQIGIPATSDQIWSALTEEISQWWGHAEPQATAVGDIFKVSWGVPWYQFEIEEAVAEKRLVWRCVDANQIIPNMCDVEKEWVGTRIHWTIESQSNGTCTLDFQHEGLTTDLSCFDFCSKTWNSFLAIQLRKFLIDRSQED